MIRRIPSRTRGSAILESVLLLPVLIALLVGTVELARITYTYMMLQKVMYSLARYLGTQQGVNFCDAADTTVQSALNYALTGTTESSDNPVVPRLTPSMFQLRIERYDPTGDQINVCDCSSTGCDPTQGGQPPGFLVVSLTDGYMVHPVFWGFSIDAFPLRPTVRVPYAGT